MPDSCLSQWQFTYSRSKGAGQVICSAYSRSLFPAAIFPEDALVCVKGHQCFIRPQAPWQSPKLPHGTDELPCWTVCGPWAVDWGDWWLFCLDYYYYYYFKGPSGGQNGFTERLNSSHAFELCDRQCLKIETAAPPCSPFPSNSSRRMKSCPQPAAPWAGCLSPAASAGAGTASLKGCQGLAGHLPKGRKERRGREKNWKITTKKTSSFLKLETLKKRFMNLWVYETTWCFGVCCWLNLAVQSLVVVSLH